MSNFNKIIDLVIESGNTVFGEAVVAYVKNEPVKEINVFFSYRKESMIEKLSHLMAVKNIKSNEITIVNDTEEYVLKFYETYSGLNISDCGLRFGSHNVLKFISSFNEDEIPIPWDDEDKALCS